MVQREETLGPGSSADRGAHTGVGSSTQVVGDHCILSWGELLCMQLLSVSMVLKGAMLP